MPRCRPAAALLLALPLLGVAEPLPEAAPAAAAAGAPEAASIEAQLRPLLQKFVSTVESLHDYRVVTTKQQRIKGKLQATETLLLKHRRAPECRYMKWLEEPHKNREVILCPDRYEGKMQVRQPGLMGLTLSVDPNGSFFASSGNLRPIADSGIFNLARTLKADAERNRGQLQQAPPRLTHETIHGQASVCIHRDHGGSDDRAPYPVGARRLCFDQARALPTEIKLWDSGGQLMEHYTFRDYQLDVGLTDLDFDFSAKNR